MANFNKSMSIEDILDKMDKNNGITEIFHAGPCFLNYKLQESLLEQQDKRHKELLISQNGYNEKQLSLTRWLVLGTWALVIATIAISMTSSIWPK